MRKMLSQANFWEKQRLHLQEQPTRFTKIFLAANGSKHWKQWAQNRNGFYGQVPEQRTKHTVM
jgi:hypothetical protein